MKKNVVFILKIAVVLVLVVGILLATSALYRKGLTYVGTYAGMAKFDDVPESIDYANFGPSYGMNCFRYDTIEAKGKTAFNFSLTMQDLYHDHALYKTYEDRFSDGAVIAIPLSYFSFCSDTEAPSSNRYYKLLDRSYIKGYTLENEISTKYVPVYGKGSSLIRDVTNDLLNSIMKKSVQTAEAENERDAAKDQPPEEAELKADSVSCIVNIETGNLKAFADQIGTNEAILIDWIKEMQAKGLRPVLLLTPYWHDYAFGFDEALLKTGYHDPVARVVEQTGVDYVDFCGEAYDEFIHTPRYFNNCDHVSEEGSEEFMKLYVQYLTEKGWI